MLRAWSIVCYLLAVATDGDYLNDWLTHVDHETASYLERLGRLIAVALGL